MTRAYDQIWKPFLNGTKTWRRYWRDDYTQLDDKTGQQDHAIKLDLFVEKNLT